MSQILASAARTTSGTTGPVAASGANLNVFLDITAVGGVSPSLTLSIEWSPDGVTYATPGDALAAQTAVGADVLSATVKAQFFRLRWVISGTTPSFTFSASAHMTS